MITPRSLLELTQRRARTALADELGLAMSAATLGGSRAVLQTLIEKTVLVKYPADQRIGQLVADIAVAAALVAATSAALPTGSLWDRAAKLAATTAATRAGRTAIEILGTTTYAEAHPFIHQILSHITPTTRSTK